MLNQFKYARYICIFAKKFIKLIKQEIYKKNTSENAEIVL